VTRSLYLPQRFARAFFLATDEIIGRHGLDAVLSLAGLERFHDALPPDTLERSFSFAEMAAFNRALEEMYGIRGGRGMAQRIGRAWVAQGFINFGAFAGMRDPAFRALPRPARLELGLLALAHVFNQFSDQQCAVSRTNESYHLTVDPCAFAWERRAEKPVCAAFVGLVQETASLASGGYEYGVQEIQCRATGADACVFTVSLRPHG